MLKELIAFRSIDQDGDIWCETAFIFNSEEDVKKGLSQDSPMLIDAFCDQDDKTLQEFEIQVISEIINSVSFYTEYAHEVRLVRMDKGFIYK